MPARDFSRGRDAEARRIRALEPEVAATLFEAMETKRHGLDQMMWQTPALGLVAQSFLLTIGLGEGSSWLARVVAASLGVVAALGAIQLLLKHRFHEEMQSRWLEQFALARGWPAATPESVGRLAYADRKHPWKRRAKKKAGVHRRAGHRVRRWMTGFSSPYVWVLVLSVFAAAEVVVLATALIDHLTGGSTL